jgi:threonine synthase
MGSPDGTAGGPSRPDGGTDAPPGLRCPACGGRYPPGPAEPWRCPRDGSPLELDADPRPAGGPPDPGSLARDAGLWAFEAFLPVGRAPADRVTLGEGWTPLVDAPAWGAAFKLEYVFPTGSFKDRGATTTLTRAVELGVSRVVEDSSGNAGAAVATYAARAGVDCTVYVPADATASKLRAIERAGATTIRVEGDRAAVTDACVAAVEGRTDDGGAGGDTADAGGTGGAADAWYASHAWNPAFFAGTATFAFEVAAQRGWTVPDAVVLPLGHGTLFLGAARGFRALAEAGWTDRVPRLLGAQAAGYAPVVAELHGEAAAAGDNDVADGIQIREPARLDGILAAVKGTGGDAVALDADAVAAELDRLHRRGFYTEPTCAVAPAALRAYRARGVLDPDDDVVVALTGSGLKG